MAAAGLGAELEAVRGELDERTHDLQRITAAGLTTHDEIEARTDRTMVERAARTIIVADSSKIGRSALAAICPLEEIDELITDDAAPAEQVAALRAGGIEVIQV